MIKNLINKYIEKLTINDIYEFASKNGITLKEYEANIIYSYTKKYWEVVVFSDHNPILRKVKDSLEPTTYNKLNELINFYKDKYKNYL